MSKSRIAQSKNVRGHFKRLLTPIAKIYEGDFNLNTESTYIPALYSPVKNLFISRTCSNSILFLQFAGIILFCHLLLKVNQSFQIQSFKFNHVPKAKFHIDWG